jgi:hypothetical protein
LRPQEIAILLIGIEDSLIGGSIWHSLNTVSLLQAIVPFALISAPIGIGLLPREAMLLPLVEASSVNSARGECSELSSATNVA